QQAENLTQHLQVSNAFGAAVTSAELTPVKLEEAVKNIMKTADREWGGFGRAPKFPQTFTIHFLLAFAQVKKDEEALKQALLSIDKMIRGGIYDQIGGGFARYSTDTEWLVPHFEKMLYDNALLVSTLSDAYRFTKNEAYKKVIEETLAFVERELMHPNGGFYSALDADSEGEEGKYYVWQLDEVKSILGPEAGIFCDYFDITENGNWEGKNIPWVKIPLSEFARLHNLDEDTLSQLIDDGKQKLLAERSQRVRPGLDDKLLLNWNALMNIAYCKAYAATGREHYRDIATQNMQFLLTAFGSHFHDLHHSWKEDQARHPAFLDDYAFLIAALIELAQVTADYTY
ncbi:MAG TPA: thioredoxin domain-containing protein, partial [Flavisolibacter sp.]|nr:thioredoxin domain-containing protein [Flavisolibacter sp.]